MKTSKLKALALLIPMLAILPATAGAAHADIDQDAIEEFLGSIPNNMMYLLPVDKLAQGLEENPEDWMVLDVRSPSHYNNGHIEGAMHVPLVNLVPNKENLPMDKKIAVVCAMDTNSAFAVALLRMWGFDAWIVQGGVPGWVKAGMPLVM